jgi:hypothetical protein
MTGHEMGDFLLVPKELQEGGLKAQPNSKADLSFLQRSGGDKKQLQPIKQDGENIGQYIDHGDGTITDTATKLMWKRCSEGLSGVNCKEGKIEKYKWDDAVQRFKDVEYAGYADWRLPTLDELKTLVYCSNGVKDKDDGWCNKGSETPTINQQAFPNTEVNWFWSGSPVADFSDYAWLVSFNYGNSYSDYRNGSYAVRLVRGGQ